MKKILSLITVLALVAGSSSISFTSNAFAKPSSDKGANRGNSAIVKEKDEDKGGNKGNSIEIRKALEEEKLSLENDKEAKEEKLEELEASLENATGDLRDEILDAINDLKDEIKDLDDDLEDLSEVERKDKFKDILKNSKDKEDLEAQIEDLEDDEDSDAEESEELINLRNQVREIKLESLKIRNELRKAIRKNYSAEEIAELEEIKAELIEKYEDIKVLDIDSVLSNTAVFKFDTPPVIKGSRVLIPVSAITNGLGAEIEWIGEEKKVIITMGEDVIELWIDENIALVNGEEVTLDAKAELMNNRTIVPLRFIAETFNLKANWNPDDETVEIIDEDEEDDSETVTGSAANITIN